MIDLPNEWTIDWRYKGFPPSADGIPASTIPARKWNVLRDFTTPVAVIKQSALAHNLTTMRAYCDAHDVRIAPHGKTTMSPELIRAQLDNGAWGVTAATAWQARAMAGFGARRIVVANECLDPLGLAWISSWLDTTPDAEVLVFADSVAAVEVMRAARPTGAARPLAVLVEMGPVGGRAGARTVDEAVAVGRAVAAAPELELAGVAGFEGIIAGPRNTASAPVRDFLTGLRRAAEALMADGAFRPDHPVILSAGGSVYFDQVVDVFTADRSSYRMPVEVVIRSGCYLTHDHGAYGENSPFAADPASDFRPALEVWARVVSAPEDGLAIVDAGKRDVSVDGLMPVVLARLRDGRLEPVPSAVVVDHCNDQHGYVHVSEPGALRVGDLVALGISHPCLTFDKWRALPVVDDEYGVVSAVRTFF